MFDAASLVARSGACSLPGVNIKYENFMYFMAKAVAKGFVRDDHAGFVAQGLRYGFMAGVQRDLLRGQRVFRNYPPAENEYKQQVQAATQSRVDMGKTLAVAPWQESLREVMRDVFGDYFIFPLNARLKPLEPGKVRPISGHTRTGFNSACVDTEILSHAVNSAKEMKAALETGFLTCVSDVDGAFPMLPWAPVLWPFLFHRHYSLADVFRLLVNLTGDFGTRGFPGVFKIFFVDVVLQMARCERLLTLPMAVHVDDIGLVGSFRAQVLREMRDMQQWAESELGFLFKVIKDKAPRQVQLYTGFWWDSFERTLTLEEEKLGIYMCELLDFAERPTLSLHDRQHVAGRMMRAVLTLPPGAACLLASVFVMMGGLKLPWQKRRTSREERRTYRLFHDFLQFNAGSGYFSHDRFSQGPGVRSDAYKNRRDAGGGWVEMTGAYDWFRYGSSAVRQMIDFLEGDTAICCLSRMGPEWRHKWIPWGVDNSAFHGAAGRSYSSAARLSLLLKRLFVYQVRYQCIIRFFWLSTHENFLADYLSRFRIDDFLSLVYVVRFWLPHVIPRQAPDAGRTRHLDPREPFDADDMRLLKARGQAPKRMREYSEFVYAAVLLQAAARGMLARRWAARRTTPRVAPRREADTRANPRPAARPMRTLLMLLMFAVGGAVESSGGAFKQAASIAYPRTDIWTGLPAELVVRLDDVIDNRLAHSSMRTVASGMKQWAVTADKWGWELLIATDDAERGGKMAAMVMHMLDDTSLVFSSIQNYVWGVRQQMQLWHQADPVMGVMGWSEFMSSVKVLSWVPHEPRRALPIDLILAMARKCDRTSFRNVCFMLFIVVLLFTFSRSECPCPKHFTGAESWDDMKHWMVRDFKIEKVGSVPVDSGNSSGGSLLQRTVHALKVRFKAIKQDPRIERPSARAAPGEAAHGGSDWSWIGDVPESELSIFCWFRLYNSFFIGERSPTEPFFLASDRKRPYTYSAAMTDLKYYLGEVSDDTDYGVHGIRVTGYNASKEGNGEEITVAHGLWSDAKSASRYARWTLLSVCSISAGMLGEASLYKGEARPEERAVNREGTKRGAQPAAAGQPAGRSPPLAPIAEEEGGEGEAGDEEANPPVTPASARNSRALRLSPPPGWSVRQIEDDTVYVPPGSHGGGPVPTLAAAWAEFNSSPNHRRPGARRSSTSS